MLVNARKYQFDLIKNATYPEKAARYFLNKFNIKYEFQKIVGVHGGFFIVDFYLPEYKVGIEIDGKHHYKEENLQRDNERTKKLLKHGLKDIIRIPNRRCKYDDKTEKLFKELICKL